jgi:hypothetical protein
VVGQATGRVNVLIVETMVGHLDSAAVGEVEAGVEAEEEVVVEVCPSCMIAPLTRRLLQVWPARTLGEQLPRRLMVCAVY